MNILWNNLIRLEKCNNAKLTSRLLGNYSSVWRIQNDFTIVVARLMFVWICKRNQISYGVFAEMLNFTAISLTPSPAPYRL